jgi:hypothetical protein
MLPHLHYSPPLPAQHAPGAESDDGRGPRRAPAGGSGILAFLLRLCDGGHAHDAPRRWPAARAENRRTHRERP